MHNNTKWVYTRGLTWLLHNALWLKDNNGHTIVLAVGQTQQQSTYTASDHVSWN